MSKTNPRNIHRTEADCRREYKRGQDEGIKCGLTIMLYTLFDKYGASEDDMRRFAADFNYTVDSIAKGYIKESDLRRVVKDEYGTTLHYAEKKEKQ